VSKNAMRQRGFEVLRKTGGQKLICKGGQIGILYRTQHANSWSTGFTLCYHESNIQGATTSWTSSYNGETRNAHL